eukprot:3885986-Alexandrium_andersonii.AAC.1
MRRAIRRRADQSAVVGADILRQHSLASKPRSGRSRRKKFARAASARALPTEAGPRGSAASSSAGSRLYPGYVTGRNEGARKHEPFAPEPASGSREDARRHGLFTEPETDWS